MSPHLLLPPDFIAEHNSIWEERLVGISCPGSVPLKFLRMYSLFYGRALGGAGKPQFCVNAAQQQKKISQCCKHSLHHKSKTQHQLLSRKFTQPKPIVNQKTSTICQRYYLLTKCKTSNTDWTKWPSTEYPMFQSSQKRTKLGLLTPTLGAYLLLSCMSRKESRGRSLLQFLNLHYHRLWEQSLPQA